MPELPEVEAVSRRLQEWSAGRTLVRAYFTRPQTTQPRSGRSVARQLKGQRIARVHRRAKNVLIAFESSLTLRVHLRMTGNLWVADPKSRPVTARAWFPLDDGREIVFDDPRLLGRMEVLSASELVAWESTQGIEPLTRGFTVNWFAERLARSRKPVKVFLLDQSIVCGLGNIWAAEALYAARIHPFIPAHQLTPQQAKSLHGAIRTILNRAVESAYADYTAPGKTLESEGYGVAVYGREGEPCHRCGAVVLRLPQAGRSTYFCPRCQPEARD